jgi:hypothetical protein
MLSRTILGRPAPAYPAGSASAIRVAARRPLAILVPLLAVLLVLVALLILRPALPAAVLPIGAARTPALDDPLPARLRYMRGLVDAAEDALALTPRVITAWHWQITVRPAQPDLQTAWDDLERIAPVAVDQPDVLSLLGHVQGKLLRLAQDGSLAQQAGVAYTPDYAPVQTLLDVIDTDLAARLSPPAGPASDYGTCPVCAIE